MGRLRKVNRKTIMYVSISPSTFVIRDVNMLSEKYNINLYCLNFSVSLKGLIKVLKFHLKVLINIFKSDFLIIRFLGYHSYIPLVLSNVLRKPNFVILGGAGCHYFPEFSRGNNRKKLYGFITKRSIKNTKCFLPVHRSLIKYDYTYTDVQFKKQGLFNLYTEAVGKDYIEIFNGFDSTKFVNKKQPRENLSFITVLTVIDPKTYINKGIDLIEQIAAKHKDFKIYIVGKNTINRPFPENMIFLGFKNQEELIDLYNQKSFYFQLSISEGFPNALSEAMLCGCVPIVSDVFSMSEIVADSGLILEKKSAHLLSEKIGNLLDQDLSKLREKARKRILENYSLEKRKLAFEKLLTA